MKTNRFKKILLKLGVGVVSLGALVGILAIPSKAEVYLNATILDKTYFKQASLNYYTLNENQDWSRYHYTFIKNGVFGYEEGFTWSTNLDNFITTPNLQEGYENYIYSSYGCFYGTTWNIYQFIQEESSYPTIVEDVDSYLEYEFVTPMNLQNIDFRNSSFNAIEFLDVNNNTLYINREPLFTCSVPNCAKIRCISSDSDYGNDIYFLISAPNLNGYNNGYLDGYNSRNEQVNNLQSENNTLKNINTNLQNQVSSLQNQLQNVNGSWQSVFYTMVDIPFLTMSKVLGFEVFGLNLYRALIGIITTLAIFYLLRKIMGH